VRINVAVPEAHVSAPVLDAALEATTKLNESLLRSGELRPFDPRHPGVKWAPEPPGDGEHFDHGRIVTGRGWGDCDDLAPWRAASLRVTGEDRRARAIVRPSGPRRWHAVVRRGDGSIDDPSLDAGMPGAGRRHGVRGASQPLMMPGRCGVDGTYILRPQLAMRPVYDREHGGEIEAWQARTDLPWHTLPGDSPTDIAMASLHASPVSDQALVGALEGAIALGEASGTADEEHLDRLRCMSDMLQGASWEECAEEYGPQHADAASHVVGAFFKKLRRKIKRATRKLARPLTRAALSLAPKALQFVPGVGPLASQALQMATPHLQRAILRQKHVRPAARRAPVRRLVTPRYTTSYTPSLWPTLSGDW
jgi:hypothetical protein